MSLAARERGLLVVLIAAILALFRRNAWARVLDVTQPNFTVGVLALMLVAAVVLIAYHRREV